VDDEHDVVAEGEFVPEGEEEVALFGVGVAVRAGGVQLVGVAHPDQVAGDQATQASAGRHHVTPEVGRRRVAVLEDDRGALALVDVGHPVALNLGELLLGERPAGVGHVLSLHGMDSSPLIKAGQILRMTLPKGRPSTR
jgi:hypothetical protein